LNGRVSPNSSRSRSGTIGALLVLLSLAAEEKK
jgi:hypothetical protein